MRRVPVQVEHTQRYIVWVEVEDDQLSRDAVAQLGPDRQGRTTALLDLIEWEDPHEGDLTVSVPSEYLDTTQNHDHPLMECRCSSHWRWYGECPVTMAF